MPNVVLINPFEVPEGQEEAFLASWRTAAEFMRQTEGFISIRLHKSLDPTTKFRFVNVAEWASPQQFEAAVRSVTFQEIARKMPFAGYPALYTVAIEDPPS
jgi:heme-degrading monooxygenase HmoA